MSTRRCVPSGRAERRTSADYVDRMNGIGARLAARLRRATNRGEKRTPLTPRTTLVTVADGQEPRVRRLGKGAWLVNQPAKRGRRVSVRALGDDTWIVRRGRGRVVRQVGPPRIRTHLVLDQAAARKRMRVYER